MNVSKIEKKIVEMISKSVFILREKQRNDVSDNFTSEDMEMM